MPRVCTVCNSLNGEEIEKLLVARRPLRHIAAQYGTSTGALQRHERDHLPEALIKANEALNIVRYGDVLKEMVGLKVEAKKMLAEAKKDGNFDRALKAMAEARKNLETQWKIQSDNRRAQQQAKEAHQPLINLDGLPPEIAAYVLSTGRLPSEAERASLTRPIELKIIPGTSTAEAAGNGEKALKILKPCGRELGIKNEDPVTFFGCRARSPH